ncbi:hypothetical protein Tco_0154756 [Tanacetum coccineum]
MVVWWTQRALAAVVWCSDDDDDDEGDGVVICDCKEKSWKIVLRMFHWTFFKGKNFNQYFYRTLGTMFNLSRKSHFLEDKQISSVEVFYIWKAFGRNTRDLGSFREETDKTTDLHQHFSRLCSQRLETASQDTRDAVKIQPMTAAEIWRQRHNIVDLKKP